MRSSRRRKSNRGPSRRPEGWWVGGTGKGCNVLLKKAGDGARSFSLGGGIEAYTLDACIDAAGARRHLAITLHTGQKGVGGQRGWMQTAPRVYACGSGRKRARAAAPLCGSTWSRVPRGRSGHGAQKVPARGRQEEPGAERCCGRSRSRRVSSGYLVGI